MRARLTESARVGRTLRHALPHQNIPDHAVARSRDTRSVVRRVAAIVGMALDLHGQARLRPHDRRDGGQPAVDRRVQSGRVKIRIGNRDHQPARRIARLPAPCRAAGNKRRRSSPAAADAGAGGASLWGCSIMAWMARRAAAGALTRSACSRAARSCSSLARAAAASSCALRALRLRLAPAFVAPSPPGLASLANSASCFRLMAMVRASSAVCAACRAVVTMLLTPALRACRSCACCSSCCAFRVRIGAYSAAPSMRDLHCVLRLVDFEQRFVLIERQLGAALHRLRDRAACCKCSGRAAAVRISPAPARSCPSCRAGSRSPAPPHRSAGAPPNTAPPSRSGRTPADRW